jgi:putative ABC transport system permease protein
MTLRLAIRALLRRPAFTLLAIGAVALGVAGTTAVWALVHAVLVRPLPFEQPERLVTPDVRSPQGYTISISIPNYRDWGERNRVLEAYGGSAGWTFVRPAAGGAEVLRARVVLGDFFEVLGLRAASGRVFEGAETEPGAPPIAVLSHGFWQRAYGGDPDVIGRTLATDEFTATIVGVLGPGAGYPSPEVEAYLPMGALGESLPWGDRWSSFGTRMLGRLAPGVTLAEAQADLSRVAAEVAEEEGRPVATPEIRPLEDLFLGDVRTGLWVLMGAVGLLLLIACANVANLSLARTESRAREVAIRVALGAGRGRIARLLLAESAVVAGVGGVVGIVAAAVAVGALPGLLPLDLPTLVVGRIGLSAPVLLFGAGVTVLSGALFGLIPAIRAGRGGDGSGALLRLGGRVASTAAARRLRDGLVVIQVALSLVLLVAAGLLTRSLARLGRVDTGFVAESVVSARLQTPEGLFPSPESRWAFYDAMKSRLDAAPGIERSAATLLIPLSGGSWERAIAPEGASLELGEMESVLYNVVSEDYFRTLGIPLVQGRALESTDGPGSPRVVVVDRTMAELFWPGEDPIGRRVAFEQHGHEGPVEWLTVVGVAANVRHYELQFPSRIQAWVPMRQARPLGLSLVVRSRPGAEAAAIDGIRRVLADLAPGIALRELRPMADIVDDRLGPTRSLGTLTAVFAAFAVLLAALGIFAVLSLAVRRRRRELGIRMAVGATPGGVLGLVARYGLALAAIGAGVGIAGAVAATRILGSLLFEVDPFDPVVYGVVTVGMLALTLAAATVPALRAAAVEPARVLREE